MVRKKTPSRTNRDRPGRGGEGKCGKGRKFDGGGVENNRPKKK